MREALNNLKEYVRDDDVYQRWSEGNITKVNDFDWYCIDHCNDINTVITGYNTVMKNMKEMQQRINDAIKYIENTNICKYGIFEDDEDLEYTEPLLEILGGKHD